MLVSDKIVNFLRQQKEFNLSLQKQLQNQQAQIDILLDRVNNLNLESVPMLPTPIPTPTPSQQQRNWLPIFLYGTIKEDVGKFTYSFCRKETRFPYTSEESRMLAYQQVVNKQVTESLANGRNNRYYIEDNTVHLELRDGTFALFDVSDLNIVAGKVWYPYKGHIITRVNGSRIKMCEMFIGNSQIYFENGNILDNRRINLSVSKKSGDFFKLTKEQWTYLKDNLSQEDAVNYLNALVNDVAEFPKITYTNQQIQQDYFKIINSPTIDIVTCGLGGKVTRYFMNNAIFHSRKEGFPTINEVWSNPKMRERLFIVMLRLNISSFNASSLIKAFALNFYKVGNFPPLAARNLYDYHFPSYLTLSSNLRVLDFCSGFGGRLIGFWSSKHCSHYVGIDPNPRLVQPYANIVNWLKSQHGYCQKYVTMIQGCAEDVTYEDIIYEDGTCVQDQLFDIIFTSPPYFNLETYGTESTQSSIRYPEIAQWRDSFLFATLSKVIPVLKPGGVLAINIKDSNQWNISLCAEMVEFIASKGLQSRDTLNLNLSKRPGSTKESTEPIFIFTKPTI